MAKGELDLEMNYVSVCPIGYDRPFTIIGVPIVLCTTQHIVICFYFSAPIVEKDE